MASKNPLEISMKDTITALLWVVILAVVLFMLFVMKWTLLPIAVVVLSLELQLVIQELNMFHLIHQAF